MSIPTHNRPHLGRAVSDLPYDVLREIFLHCLPQYPLNVDVRQPNMQVAPMLLCHVCSSWRFVALSSPQLWARLSCRLTLFEDNDNEEIPRFLKTQIEFLQWWKQNQGAISPFLSIELESTYCNSIYLKTEECLIASDSMNFLLAWIASAQYLDIDPFLWEEFDRILHQDDTYPSMVHTLIRRMYWTDEGSPVPNVPYLKYSCISSLSKLRRLCITEAILPGSMLFHNATIPTQWTTLTHISLYKVDISHKFWFAILRATPNLQWAYLEIEYVVTDTPSDIAKYVHHHLNTLFIVFHYLHSPHIFPLCKFFSGLELPALRKLSISSDADSWNDDTSTLDLVAASQSAQGVETLFLGKGFLCAGDPVQMNLKALIHAPLWVYLPRLSHLQVQITPGITFRGPTANDQMDVFLRNFLTPDQHWVDLGSEGYTTPIRKLTFITDDAQLDSVVELAASRFQELAKRTPDIEFQLASELETQAASDAWKAWGAIA
ncbi:hypothetical protein BDN70DRAFT_992745 [Pholiota conissans]|uniref:F-box domain-containing protein n=1 Tax=Pholiota conissans TaxID=109636 RepID=A0A9P5Z4A7_9AGAR|nr:hypothetical protein BDN70DRAFT_992745 [Pholiota conissans]